MTQRNSKTAQAAAVLEKSIYQGKYLPNTPLPGTRELSKQLGVSQRVILSALDILEKKDLICRCERKRVYVKAREAAAGAKEILFFAFGDELHAHSICNMLSSIALHSGKNGRYDFFSRFVSTGDAFTPGRLNRELSRLENLGFIDCAIFYCRLDRKGMEKCMRLPYPVIFLGEKPDFEEPPEGARLLSPNSADLPLAAARRAADNGCRKFIFCCWDVPAEQEYGQKAMDVLKTFLTQKNIDFEIRFYSGKNAADVRNNFESEIPAYAASLSPGSFIVTHNIHSKRFSDGELLPESRYPGLTLIATETPDTVSPVIGVRRDFGEFIKILFEMIDSSGTPIPHGYFHKTADLHFETLLTNIK